MQRYKLIIAYDGHEYSGWQIQPGHRTIQGELEACLGRLAGEAIKVHGSGRTDQGVHALGQVAHVDFPAAFTREKLLQAANAILPPAIRLLKITTSSAAFHARRSARAKEYRYLIWNGPLIPPFLFRYRTHIRRPLDVPAMRAAAKHLVGRHDFAAFTANPNRVVESTIRKLSLLDIRRRGREIAVVARGDGFLYRMVRSLAGLLIRVGQGDLPPGAAGTILAQKKRTAVVPTAPPNGLFLWKVFYE